jgi:hypothetical protein
MTFWLTQQPNSGLSFFIYGSYIQLDPPTTHTHTHTHTRGRNSLNEGSVSRRGRYLCNTQQTHCTNIHALSIIQTGGFRGHVAADLRLRLHDHERRRWNVTCGGNPKDLVRVPLCPSQIPRYFITVSFDRQVFKSAGPQLVHLQCFESTPAGGLACLLILLIVCV